MDIRSAALAATLATSALFLGGCLISSSSKTYQSGAYVSATTLRQIEPGQTSEDFVLAALGPPSSRSRLDDGTELWKWNYTRRRNSRGAVLFLLASDTRSESQVTTFVLLRDGIVERVWQDE